jgi:hypothetical protein
VEARASVEAGRERRRLETPPAPRELPTVGEWEPISAYRVGDPDNWRRRVKDTGGPWWAANVRDHRWSPWLGWKGWRWRVNEAVLLRIPHRGIEGYCATPEAARWAADEAMRVGR